MICWSSGQKSTFHGSQYDKPIPKKTTKVGVYGRSHPDMNHPPKTNASDWRLLPTHTHTHIYIYIYIHVYIYNTLWHIYDYYQLLTPYNTILHIITYMRGTMGPSNQGQHGLRVLHFLIASLFDGDVGLRDEEKPAACHRAPALSYLRDVISIHHHTMENHHRS